MEQAVRKDDAMMDEDLARWRQQAEQLAQWDQAHAQDHAMQRAVDAEWAQLYHQLCDQALPLMDHLGVSYTRGDVGRVWLSRTPSCPGLTRVGHAEIIYGGIPLQRTVVDGVSVFTTLRGYSWTVSALTGQLFESYRDECFLPAWLQPTTPRWTRFGYWFPFRIDAILIGVAGLLGVLYPHHREPMGVITFVVTLAIVTAYALIANVD